MNDGILKDPFLVQYMTADDIVDGIMSFGLGALVAKCYVETAYPIIPLHLDDRHLLGMHWGGKYLVDRPYLLVYVQPHISSHLLLI